MNFLAGDYVMTNTPSMLRTMAKRVQELGVRPELEVFDSGHLVFVKHLISEGLLDDPIMIQLCMGIPLWRAGRSHDLSGFGQCAARGFDFLRLFHRPDAAALRSAGGALRRQRAGGIGGQPLSFARRASHERSLVERAVTILEAMNVKVLGPDEVRKKLKLVKRG